MSKGDRKENAQYKPKWYVYITLRKYNVRYDHVLHPIPEYKTSKHVIMYTNIICKDKK